MTTASCKAALVAHLRVFYPKAGEVLLQEKNWKRTSKRRISEIASERVFTHKLHEHCSVTVGEYDTDHYVFDVHGCGDENPLTDSERRWNECLITADQERDFSNYYFAMLGPCEDMFNGIVIVSKSDWDENGCFSDDHFPFEDQLDRLGISNLQEGFFEHGVMEINAARDILLNLGMEENGGITGYLIGEFISSEAETLYDGDGNFIGQSATSISPVWAPPGQGEALYVSHYAKTSNDSSNALNPPSHGVMPRIMDLD